ncbi:lipopolysaccharide biosynthesis protein RfbH [Thermodesulfobacteriota bacterium]
MAGKAIAGAKQRIFREVKKFFDSKEDARFVPGKSQIRYAEPIFDEKEVSAVIDTLLDGWLGLRKKGREFEVALSKYIGGRSAVLTNSGSSANLLALASLKCEQSPFRLREGDEVIVAGCSFPTTINPIIQNGFIPVLIDVRLGDYNIDPERLEKAVRKKTKAIFIAHTFGNPNQMDTIMQFAGERGIIVLEDNCDSIGSRFNGKKTGSFGAIATHSFYPAHHITMGEGGAIVLNEEGFEPIVRSLRDWGRACVCSVCDNSVQSDYFCPMRFEHEAPGLPKGYDKKYIYTNIGYNLKPTEMQAALGLQQLKRIERFKKARQRNFSKLYNFFKQYEDYFVLPEALPESDVSWFCFPLTIKDRAKFSRMEMITFLEKKNRIETRPFFSSNIMRHPAYKDVQYRIVGKLPNCTKILQNSFIIGVHPGITEEISDFMVRKISEFMEEHA